MSTTIKLRITVVVAIAAILALALLVPSQASARTIYIGCADYLEADTDFSEADYLVPKRKPRSCDTTFPWLSHATSFGYLRHIRWHHWGRSRAWAMATVQWKTYEPPSRDRYEVYRIRCVFSACAYTRMRTIGYDGRWYHLKLPWGYDLWPLL